MVKYEIKTDTAENLYDGHGKAFFRRCLEESEYPDNCGLASLIELEKGTSIGYHQHTGDSEMYCFVEGEGVYKENGKEYEIKPGMVTMLYDGGWHGMENTGDGALKFFAVIFKK